jgi:hypothetical protein
LKIVGVLAPSVALFADSALVMADPAMEPLFAGTDASLSEVRIVRLTDQEFRDRKVHAQLAKAFPTKTFALLTPHVGSSATGYYLYLAGQTLLLIGGTGLLIMLYRWMARWITWPVLAEPLGEIVGRPRLFWGTHIAYFGLYVLAATVIHHNPALQAVMMSGVQQAFSSEGPLAVAGAAYQSGNMLRAAAVTFGVNLLLGAILVITLPSLIIPGIGVLVAAFRATLWGLLLGPSDTSLALAMIPHSGTLLLEGEGYIVATFFALLVPIALNSSGRSERKTAAADEWSLAEPLDNSKHESLGRRFLRALRLNVKGIVLVALILAVAACYEAVEVILMAGL